MSDISVDDLETLRAFEDNGPCEFGCFSEYPPHLDDLHRRGLLARSVVGFGPRNARYRFDISRDGLQALAKHEAEVES